MISLIRDSIFIRLIWGFMALYLLNISVDPEDPYPEHIPEDLSINDQESILEIIFEKFLGYEEAFAEYDDNDSEEQNKKSSVQIDLFQASHYHVTNSLNGTQIQRFEVYLASLSYPYYSLFTPPPEA